MQFLRLAQARSAQVRPTQGYLATAVGMAGMLMAAGVAAPAQAQTANIPTRDELRGITAPPPEAPTRLSIEGGIERSPCPLADPQFKDITVTIGEVVFGGLKGADAAELAPAWKPYAGQLQPIAVLCEVRDAAATILRSKGYLAAVQVPAQRIENGQVRMEVLYARVTAVRARGETRGAEAKLEQYLGKLTEGEVFNRFTAERYLLLARDLPGYNVQLTLRPADTGPGDLIGELAVVREPYAVDFTLQNLASESTGRWGGQVRVQAFGLTGMGDATSLSYYATSDFSEQHIVQAAHEFRPGSQGLVVSGQFTYAWTKPDIGAAPGAASIDARTLFASLAARYPLKRTQASNLWLGAGLDLVNQNVDLLGPLTRDKVRVAWARLDYDAVDTGAVRPRWRLAGTFEARQGLAILDATRSCIGAGCPAGSVPTSRFDGSPTATVLRAQGEVELALGKDAAFSLAPRAQYAFRPLLSFEEFSGGNYTIGRGFDPGALQGDSGVGATAELRARFRLNATLAVPLEHAPLQARRGDPRFLLTFTTRLLPWRAL